MRIRSKILHMDMQLRKIDRDETLRYLGIVGGVPDGLVAAQLAEAEGIVLRLAQPRAVYRLFDLERDGDVLRLQGTALDLEGEDIRAHLKAADRCVLMAATLGAAVERELRRIQVTDMALATVLDAAAGTAIEQICDDLQRELAAIAASEGRFLTDRFSPGYGDMPLEQQRRICAVLDAGKIGLTVTEHFLLTPRKSVTAVSGLCSEPVAAKTDACAVCKIADTCKLRKAGTPCGKPFVQ